MLSHLAFIEGIGGPELMMIMFVILLLFGADRLPGLARSFGKSMREFKKAASGVEEEFKRAMDDDERKEILQKNPAGALARPADSSPTLPPPAPPDGGPSED